MRLWFTRGQLAPGADEDECAGGVELVERLGRGAGVAGALEREVVGRGDRPPHRCGGQVVGGEHGTRAEGRGAVAPGGRGLAHRHVGHAVGGEDRDHEEPGKNTGPQHDPAQERDQDEHQRRTVVIDDIKHDLGWER